LINFVRALIATNDLEVKHSARHQVNFVSRVFPAEQITVRFADFSSWDLEHEHDGLDDAWHADHIHSLDFFEALS
jgi:hypothetical protein